MVDEPSRFTLHTVLLYYQTKNIMHHPELHISLKLLYAKLTTMNYVTITDGFRNNCTSMY